MHAIVSAMDEKMVLPLEGFFGAVCVKIANFSSGLSSTVQVWQLVTPKTAECCAN
jgi:hypothetical protein